MVGKDTQPAFLAAHHAIGLLGIPSTIFGAFGSPLSSDCGDQEVYEGSIGAAAQHHLHPGEARDLLVRTPVDLLVLDSAAIVIGGEHAPDLWRAALTGPAVLLVEAGTAAVPCWRDALDGFPCMTVGGAGGVHVVVLDEAGDASAAMLQSILNEPAALAGVQRCLERLGEGLVARRAAQASQATAERLEIALAEIGAQSDGRLVDLVAARQEIRKLEASLQAKDAGSERSNNNTSALNAQSSALRETLAMMEAALVAQNLRLADAEERLAALLRSTSWRLTGPLRSVLSRTPRLARRLRRMARLAWRVAMFPVAGRNRVGQADSVTPPVASEISAAPALVTTVAPEPDMRRIEELERRAAKLESRLDLERDRIDWALGSSEGVTALIDAYHAERKTDGYRAAFAASDPLVSICVATMDRGDILTERCIASILAQTHRNIQVVVVGDNCLDDTAQHLATLRDGRIQFVNLPERGPYPAPGFDRWCVAGASAMNHALSLCEGAFVTHLDDDDAMAPHRIETMLAAAREAGADFLWHSFWNECDDGTWIKAGNGQLILNEVTTGSIFYHRYFARFPWDTHAYRTHEPGDWNRLRKIKLMRPHLRYVDEPLMFHHRHTQKPFVARAGERFLE
jgi:hypothetical protein